MKKVLLLGCGNMGGAVALGAYQVDPTLFFYTYTPTGTRAKKLADETGGEQLVSLSELPKIDMVILAVKPQNFNELAPLLKGKLGPEVVIISLMVGITSQSIKEKLGVVKVVRTMPNTPAKIGKGVTAYFISSVITAEETNRVETILRSLGEIFPVKSDLDVDLFGSIVGAAPAYFYLFLEGLIKAYEKAGADPFWSRELLLKTFIGAASLIEKEKLSPSEMIAQVASKKGVTEEGINNFHKMELFKIIELSTNQAFERSKELSKQLS